MKLLKATLVVAMIALASGCMSYNEAPVFCTADSAREYRPPSGLFRRGSSDAEYSGWDDPSFYTTQNPY